MAGSKIGGIRCAATNKARYGQNYYVKLGHLGGKAGHTGGFYANRDLASIAGRLGGSISRRGENKLTERERREIRRAYEELMDVHLKAKRERADEGALTVYDRKRGLVLNDAA